MPPTFKAIFVGDNLFVSLAGLLGYSGRESGKLAPNDFFAILNEGYNLVVVQEDILGFDLTRELKTIEENYPQCNILTLPREKSTYSARFLRYLSERAVGVDISKK